jgi:hypothetical protein
MKIYPHMLALAILCNSYAAQAQGCSDAGVCTAGAINIQNEKTANDTAKVAIFYPFKLTLQQVVGSGEQRTWHISQVLDLDYYFNTKLSMQVKVPFHTNIGNLATTAGFGDLICSFSYKFTENKKVNYFTTLGAKLPSGRTTISKNANALPMSYQTGIGTLDALVAVGAKWNNWTAVIGYQHVVEHHNKNSFQHIVWLTNPKALRYNNSNQLKRGNDAILRVDKFFSKKKWSFSPGVLFIYRLQKDRTTNEQGIEQANAGSDGLSINLNFASYIPLTQRSQLSIVVGIPTLVRHVRPDGLTRTAQLSVGYMYKFG